VTALVGAGQDTFQALAFFPMNLRIHTGDTVTWRMNGDELHTVAFVQGFDPGPFPVGVTTPLAPPTERVPAFAVGIPGAPPEALQLNPLVAWPTRQPGAPIESYSGSGFLNSGVLADESLLDDAPPNETFSVTFPTPGVYSYICLIHTINMMGTVEVVGPEEIVPDQAAIDATANAEITALLQLIGATQDEGNQTARSEPGPAGTTFWYVRAGMEEFISGDTRAQVMDFLPKATTVQAGDTVIWSTDYFHTVSFVPTPPSPELFEPIDQPTGPPVLALDPDVVLPRKPSATYDPSQYYNSGILGPFTPFGLSWALTFDRPGTYEYICAIHDEIGMKGTITVLPR
jgi:plastocyanin